MILFICNSRKLKVTFIGKADQQLPGIRLGGAGKGYRQKGRIHTNMKTLLGVVVMFTIDCGDGFSVYVYVRAYQVDKYLAGTIFCMSTTIQKCC